MIEIGRADHLAIGLEGIEGEGRRVRETSPHPLQKNPGLLAHIRGRNQEIREF